MPSAEALFRRAALDLTATGANWALIGALAVGLRAEPRFTRDVDFAVSVASDADAEHLIFDLQQLGYEVIASLEHEVSGRLATIRLLAPGATSGTAPIDLLFASSGIEPEIVASATELEIIPQFHGLVAATGHLIALKLLATGDDRPYDAGDLHALVMAADQEELARAGEAVRVITQRGYNRDRDLVAALDEAVARWRSSDAKGETS